MEYHHQGYVRTDPRIRPASGFGIDRPTEIPRKMDVLIVGAGPAGALLAAQLSRFPNVNVRIVERRPSRLEIGHGDGIKSRSVETFQAFGFASRIIDEAYQITETRFWKPNPANPSEIVRTVVNPDDPTNLSEFPHLIVNQARVIDYFMEDAALAPGRVVPDYGIEFVDLAVEQGATHPVKARLRYTSGERQGQEFTVRAKYVVGADGARSGVRTAIGHRLHGDAAMHAWGVLDVLAETDFPDIRVQCVIQSNDGGNILLIPREGGHLFRVYVDLGETGKDDNGAVRSTPFEAIVARANAILSPYSIDVKSVGWWSVYEVAHRLTDGFDDVPPHLVGKQTPRVFLMGDACHTHSAKAGQGMNVSMQDAFNLGWKLGAVVEGRAPATLLDTYAAERKVIAKDMIDFDKAWSTLMATPAEALSDPTELERAHVAGYEFSNGYKTEYPPSQIVLGNEHQALATGFPVGKRFHSAKVIRRSDSNMVQLGHLHEADGRWRIYAFADKASPSDVTSKLHRFGLWLGTDPESPVVRHTPAGGDDDQFFDVKVIYPCLHTELETAHAPKVFKPKRQPFGITDINKIFARGTVDKQSCDIFAERGISEEGAVVVVRPDMYVAAVLPLDARSVLTEFFSRHFLPRG